MTVHRIWMPDSMRGGEPRVIDWDDAAGTIEGDHWRVADLRRLMAPGIRLGQFGAYLDLTDPMRDAPQFLAAVAYLLNNFEWDPAGLPASLRDVEPAEWTAYPYLGPGVTDGGDLRNPL